MMFTPKNQRELQKIILVQKYKDWSEMLFPSQQKNANKKTKNNQKLRSVRNTSNWQNQS